MPSIYFEYILFSQAAIREAVVPIASKCPQLDFGALQACFRAMPTEQQHVVAAVADSDGSVSLIRLYNHVQPPFEGEEEGSSYDRAAANFSTSAVLLDSDNDD